MRSGGLLVTAPEGRVSADARAEITLGEGAPRVVGEVRTRPTQIAGVPVPAVETRGLAPGLRVAGVQPPTSVAATTAAVRRERSEGDTRLGIRRRR